MLCKIKSINIFLIIKLTVLGVLMGVVCGLSGSAFAKMVSFVTALRAEHNWLLYFLPLGGLCSVAIYRLLKVKGIGTNRVFESVTKPETVPFSLAPAVFLGSVITHLFGGSAGREGAALQLGGGLSSLFARIFLLDEKSRHILTMCSMAAFFSAIFGTPLAACIFVLEVIFVSEICLSAAIPALLSSCIAYITASALGVKPERFSLTAVPKVSFHIIWKAVIIALGCALISVLFCLSLRYTKKAFKKILKNEYLRIFVGGSVIVLITVFVGTRDYNGAGVDIIERIFEEGSVRYEAFFLKIILTALTVAAGYKGGEIIPSLFIGATLGASIALILGIAPAVGAAVGMTALFCGVTNCPIASVFLSAEMFGVGGLIYFIISSIIAYLFSGKISLYDVESKKILKR